MSVRDLYWRRIEFDDSKRYSWVFHNYSIIINSEVLIHVAKADAPVPNNDSPYFTIPFSSYRDDIRTEPGDKIYYTVRNGGELAYHYGEINETHNYQIETSHDEYVISGEKTIVVPEGAMVSLQANPERNKEETYIKYRLGNRDKSGEFRLYGAQQVAYTFTTETEITFFAENDFVLDVLITASQNVSQLSKEMQDKIDKLVADLTAAMENMATKDMLQKVLMKTKRDEYIPLPATVISNGQIKTNYFYNRFEDTETEVSENDIITALLYIDIVSSDQDVLKDTSGVIGITFSYSPTGCKVLHFSSTDPELTKLTSMGSFVINSTTPTSDMSMKWQRMRVILNIKDEYSSIITGSVTSFVKSDDVPLRASSESVSFNDLQDSVHNLSFEHLFQNVAFMKSSDVNILVNELAIGKKVLDSIYDIKTVTKSLSNSSLTLYTITLVNGGSIIFELNNDSMYDFKITMNSNDYPTYGVNKLKPFIIEFYDDSIIGNSFMMNLNFVIDSDETITTSGETVTYKTKIQSLVKRGYDYIETPLAEIISNIDSSSYKVRLISNDR